MNPFFSVFIPAKGRPSYLIEAIKSVLIQDFKDIEIVISNNGADPQLKNVAQRFIADSRVRYIEHSDVLNMPAHWEKVSQELLGKYVLVLTDRSVLRSGALQHIQEQILKSHEQLDIISWPWDIYYDHLKVLLPYPSHDSNVKLLNSNDELNATAEGNTKFPYLLPRGLNSCVSNDFIKKLRDKYGAAFRSINPDFSFAYLCLLNTEHIGYIDYSLFLSQGLKVSNGGNSYKGDVTHYLNSLGLKEPFQNVPTKIPLVQNAIHEDFLAMISLCGRSDLLKKWNRKNYFQECFAEIDVKRDAGADLIIVNSMQNELLIALEKESDELQVSVLKARANSFNLRRRFAGFIKRALGDKLETVRQYMLLCRTGRHFHTALEAAGFSKEVINEID